MEPRASRPYMPGYGTLPPDQGSGLLPWSWAEERLISSRNYWVASTLPDGSPHVMPVWGIWHEWALWFSSSKPSRKARNLMLDLRCTVATEDGANPVVLAGDAELLTEIEDVETLLSRENAKYDTDTGMDLMNPEINSAFRVRPRWVFGLRDGEFTGSPTRWTF